jgi:hypothetical protein
MARVAQTPVATPLAAANHEHVSAAHSAGSSAAAPQQGRQAALSAAAASPSSSRKPRQGRAPRQQRTALRALASSSGAQAYAIAAQTGDPTSERTKMKDTSITCLKAITSLHTKIFNNIAIKLHAWISNTPAHATFA